MLSLLSHAYFECPVYAHCAYLDMFWLLSHRNLKGRHSCQMSDITTSLGKEVVIVTTESLGLFCSFFNIVLVFIFGLVF